MSSEIMHAPDHILPPVPKTGTMHLSVSDFGIERKTSSSLVLLFIAKYTIKHRKFKINKLYVDVLAYPAHAPECYFGSERPP
jgi:hypothetical protein